MKTIGHYQITGTLGEGGMGVVYSAWDSRLNRAVALKTIRANDSDPASTERLRREARAGARVNHPNICQLYDVGSEGEQFYIAMELLEGESLASRLEEGALPVKDSVTIILSVLSALDELHKNGLIHRDLKPSNVFLTPHGVKLLDFGLARTVDLEESQARLTMPGTIIGTPRYLSPEQLMGEPADHTADVFASGAVLYEMVTGKPAFDAHTIPKLVHAVVYEHPPGLGGPPAVVAVDRAIHKALAKRPQDRYRSARAMADDLRGAMLLVDSGTTSAAPRTITRLIVLPFRMLRPDPEIDFLSFSLSDALSTSLSGLESLVVRSSLTAARFASDPVDLEALAKADVDAVLTGTILRAEDQLRVTAQLADVPSGTVRWSQTMGARLGDIFQLQDALTSRIVESLAVPLTARDRQVLARDVPASAKAYEFYLRANQLAYEARNWSVARDLYRQCLEDDPNYAPAWARLARIHRLIGMYSDVTGDPYALAEQAFQRSLALNPDLPIAHNLYTVVELETGRARQAMLRLLERTRQRSADPDLFAGLVQACRYAGLQRPAIVAHEHAVRLEPRIRTGVCHAYLMVGEYERAAEHDYDDPPLVATLALDLMGQRDKAIAHARQQMGPGMPPLFRLFYELTIACLEDRRADAQPIADQMLAKWRLRDPCATLYFGRTLAAVGHPSALSMCRRAIEGGYHCHAFLAHDPWLDSLRSDGDFTRVVQMAEAGYRDAADAFVASGGDRLLGAVE